METLISRTKEIQTLLGFYDWHTKLFGNVIDSISDKDAQNRLQTKANHVAWIAGSLVYERFQLASFLDVKLKQPSSELFKDHKGIQEGVVYPSLNEFKKDWDLIGPALRKALENVSDEKLDSPDPYIMPGKNLTLYETIQYTIDREAYCIGQIGLWRRLLGYEAMKYSDVDLKNKQTIKTS
jgi:hypothetical protein